MIEIRQGTTETIKITIPKEIPLEDITSVWVYISFHGNIIIDKKGDEIIIDAEKQELRVPLTQRETLRLPAGTKGEIQIRMLDVEGDAYRSDTEEVQISKTNKKGEIT